jgi:hypothetical protein
VADSQADHDAGYGGLAPWWAWGYIMLGCNWYGARRHWRRPPGPGDWRRRFRSRRYGDSVPLSPGEQKYPFATGAWYSLAVAAAALALFGVDPRIV